MPIRTEVTGQRSQGHVEQQRQSLSGSAKSGLIRPPGVPSARCVGKSVKYLRALSFFAFVALVLFAPLMTLGDVARSGQGSLERQVGYLLLWGCSLLVVWSPSRPLDIVKFPIPLLIAGMVRHFDHMGDQSRDLDPALHPDGRGDVDGVSAGAQVRLS